MKIRSHAQKYFLKAQRTGIGMHVPPARPKRKAAHPYPRKVFKDDLALLQAFMTYPYDKFLATCFPWSDNSQLGINYPNDPLLMVNNSAWHNVKAIPNFAQVYRYIGLLFDPATSEDHLRTLKRMNPVDSETVLLLMSNLANNLSSLDGELLSNLFCRKNTGMQNLGYDDEEVAIVPIYSNHTDMEDMF